MEKVIHAVNELPAVVEWLLDMMPGGKKFALYGGLGAGKTTFAKAFCQFLGVQGAVTSPTYALVNQYDYFDKKGQKRIIHHLDLYRLKNLQEAYDIGIEDYLYDENYCLVEWPELIESILPDGTVRINISAPSASTRKILLL